jgi:membrane-associated phospholipid phosphatase
MLSADFWRTALRRLFALYLFLSGIALGFPHRPRAWLVLLGLHLLGIVLLLGIGPAPVFTAWIAERFPRTARWLGDWYTLLIMPMLYTELAVLNVSVHNGRYFDETILAIEQRVFGGQPSRELATSFPYLPLSEFLHFSYIAYYLIIYGPFLIWYLRGRRDAHQRAAFTLMLTFFAHYLFFIYFPVQGPRYLFEAPAGAIANGFFYKLAHQILEAGSSQGAAFPSSHVGVSFTQVALTFVLLKPWAPIVFILSVGLAVGAVYAGFHYATDAVVGLIYGLLLFSLAPAIARALMRERS